MLWYLGHVKVMKSISLFLATAVGAFLVLHPHVRYFTCDSGPSEAGRHPLEADLLISDPLVAGFRMWMVDLLHPQGNNSKLSSVVHQQHPSCSLDSDCSSYVSTDH